MFLMLKAMLQIKLNLSKNIKMQDKKNNLDNIKQVHLPWEQI